MFNLLQDDLNKHINIYIYILYLYIYIHMCIYLNKCTYIYIYAHIHKHILPQNRITGGQSQIDSDRDGPQLGS